MTTRLPLTPTNSVRLLQATTYFVPNVKTPSPTYTCASCTVVMPAVIARGLNILLYYCTTNVRGGQREEERLTRDASKSSREPFGSNIP